MSKVVAYRLVAEGSLRGFDKAVQSAIEDGWQPFGSVTYSGHLWCQAVVKYGDMSNVTYFGEPINND